MCLMVVVWFMMHTASYKLYLLSYWDKLMAGSGMVYDNLGQKRTELFKFSVFFIFYF